MNIQVIVHARIISATILSVDIADIFGIRRKMSPTPLFSEANMHLITHKLN